MRSTILVTGISADYELIDSGMGEKLERFGDIVLSRPDPQALWAKKLPENIWKKADGIFTRDERKGDWELAKNVPEKWKVELGGLKFWIKPTAFKHTGVFPEQLANWEWLKATLMEHETELYEVLNLFGYTGGATLACAQAGAKVVHVDGSKAAITWARENAEISGLTDKPIRWILDDATTFVKREIKRGRKYSGIIMDPPTFGHGPEGELWKIEDDLLPLVTSCFELLENEPLFFLINGYAAGYSAIAYENVLQSLLPKYGGHIEIGELTIQESKGSEKEIPPNIEPRILPAGIFARWSRE